MSKYDLENLDPQYLEYLNDADLAEWDDLDDEERKQALENAERRMEAAKQKDLKQRIDGGDEPDEIKPEEAPAPTTIPILHSKVLEYMMEQLGKDVQKVIETLIIYDIKIDGVPIGGQAGMEYVKDEIFRFDHSRFVPSEPFNKAINNLINIKDIELSPKDSTKLNLLIKGDKRNKGIQNGTDEIKSGHEKQSKLQAIILYTIRKHGVVKIKDFESIYESFKGYCRDFISTNSKIHVSGDNKKDAEKELFKQVVYYHIYDMQEDKIEYPIVFKNKLEPLGLTKNDVNDLKEYFEPKGIDESIFLNPELPSEALEKLREKFGDDLVNEYRRYFWRPSKQLVEWMATNGLADSTENPDGSSGLHFNMLDWDDGMIEKFHGMVINDVKELYPVGPSNRVEPDWGRASFRVPNIENFAKKVIINFGEYNFVPTGKMAKPAYIDQGAGWRIHPKMREFTWEKFLNVISNTYLDAASDMQRAIIFEELNYLDVQKLINAQEDDADFERVKAILESSESRSEFANRIVKFVSDHQKVTSDDAIELRKKLAGDSKLMRKLRDDIIKVANSDTAYLNYGNVESSPNVHIQGETGTGKEDTAKSVHEISRSSKPFVSINCAEYPNEEQFALALLGSTPQAYSGAINQAGALENAGDGDLFLDEIHHLSTGSQASILRIMEKNGAYSRLGENKKRKVKCRIITATNVPLTPEFFLHDLAKRISQSVIVHPPKLEDRPEDIPEIVSAINRRGMPVPGLTEVCPLISELFMNGALDISSNVRSITGLMSQLRHQVSDLGQEEVMPEDVVLAAVRTRGDVNHRILYPFIKNVLRIQDGSDSKMDDFYNDPNNLEKAAITITTKLLKSEKNLSDLIEKSRDPDAFGIKDRIHDEAVEIFVRQMLHLFVESIIESTIKEGEMAEFYNDERTLEKASITIANDLLKKEDVTRLHSIMEGDGREEFEKYVYDKAETIFAQSSTTDELETGEEADLDKPSEPEKSIDIGDGEEIRLGPDPDEIEVRDGEETEDDVEFGDSTFLLVDKLEDYIARNADVDDRYAFLELLDNKMFVDTLKHKLRNSDWARRVTGNSDAKFISMNNVNDYVITKHIIEWYKGKIRIMKAPHDAPGVLKSIKMAAKDDPSKLSRILHEDNDGLEEAYMCVTETNDDNISHDIIQSMSCEINEDIDDDIRKITEWM